jgi:hypothetical protein
VKLAKNWEMFEDFQLKFGKLSIESGTFSLEFMKNSIVGKFS